MGKSVFSAELVTRLRRSGQLLGTVFFTFNNSDLSSPYSMMLNVAFQIAKKFPQLQAEMLKIYTDVVSPNSEKDVQLVFEKLILEPLGRLEASHTSKPLVIVLDALDESGVEDNKARKSRADMLKFISESIAKKMPAWVKLFVTGRPEDDICKRLSKYSHSIEEEMYLKEHMNDLKMFISKVLEKFLPNETDRLQATEKIMQKSEGRFMYTALISEDVDQFTAQMDEDGTEVTPAVVLKHLGNLPNGIDDCYARYMEKLGQMSGQVDHTLFLRAMVACQEPLSRIEVQFFCGYTEKTLNAIIVSMQNIFPVRDDKFYPYHKSIVDYLIEPSRSGSYFVSQQDGHSLMAAKMLSQLLRVQASEDNGYDESHGVPASLDSLSMYTSEQRSEYRYMCRHLMEHLHESRVELGFQYLMYCLLTNLPWIQSTLDCVGISTVIEAYRKVQSDEQWLEFDPSRKSRQIEIRLLWQFFKLLAPLDIRKHSSSGSWRSEICTQMHARMSQVNSF